MRQTSTKRAFAFRLHPQSGVPVYRQLIDQVQVAAAAGVLGVGEQLPTVRQVAVDLEINPNTVLRAYREMEIRGVLETQQGSGTFLAARRTAGSEAERSRQLAALAQELLSRAGEAGFSIEQLVDAVKKAGQRPEAKRRQP